MTVMTMVAAVIVAAMTLVVVLGAVANAATLANRLKPKAMLASKAKWLIKRLRLPTAKVKAMRLRHGRAASERLLRIRRARLQIASHARKSRSTMTNPLRSTRRSSPLRSAVVHRRGARMATRLRPLVNVLSV